jgi:predicted nucleic acid-binding protein
LVLLDSNIFVIDRFFPRDVLYADNKRFVDRLPDIESAISLFTLFELAGIASFNLSPRELSKWVFAFGRVYPVSVINPFGAESGTVESWIGRFFGEIADRIVRKMSFGDAILLREAEGYGVDAIVTWNTKDFARRSSIRIQTPRHYL